MSMEVAQTLRVFFFGIVAYGLVVVAWRVLYRVERDRLQLLETALAAALTAGITVVALSDGGSLLYAGVIGVILIMIGDQVIVRLFGEPTAESVPLLLLYSGEYSNSAIRSAGLTRGRVQEYLREQGIKEPGQVEAVVLEPSGEIRVFGAAYHDDTGTT